MNPIDGRQKRYGWLRLYNGFSGHRKWRTVALLASAEMIEVEAVALRLLECANKGKPRGSLADFSYLECAADIGRSLDLVTRIYTVFEQIGWIDREYLSTWDERQPDKPDPTNSQRQARFREKKRAEKNVEQLRESNGEVTRYVTPKTKTETSILAGPITWQQREALFNGSAQRHLPLPPVGMKKGVFR